MKKIFLFSLIATLMLSLSAFSQGKDENVTKIKLGKKIIVSIDEDENKTVSITFEGESMSEEIDTTIVGNDTIITITKIMTDSIDNQFDKTIVIDGDTIFTDAELAQLGNLADSLSLEMQYSFDFDMDSLTTEIELMVEELREEQEAYEAEAEELEHEYRLKGDEEREKAEEREKDKKKKSKFKGHWAGFEFGFNGLTQNQELISTDLAYSNRTFRSWNFGINLIPINYGFCDYFGIVSGLGMGWKNYHFGNQYIMTNTASGVDFVAPANSSVIITKNRLSMFYLTVPLAFELQFPVNKNKDEFFIMAGGYGQLRLDSDYRTEIEVNGASSEDHLDGDFFLTDFEYGLTARIGFERLNFYANYSMTNLWRENSGPEVAPVTFGMTIVPFY